ncbi:MAG: asparagine synthase (glutamine-hydrolyzing) [Aquabacterium sp.]
MCGIVGVAAKAAEVSRDWLTVGRDAMAHRGPDDAGTWWSDDGRVGLGHRRLAIVDLSPLGHQPMHHHAGGLTIVFNGEIYNHLDLHRELSAKGHVFRSHSDTEVILAAYREWGTSCLARFNGMFAFALFDASERLLFMARDRAGEKPLFYRLSDGRLTFGSELKALMPDPAMQHRVDVLAMDLYLSMGYIPGDHCIVQGVNKLPPAHALTFHLDTGALRRWRYWQVPASPAQQARADEESLLHELESLLEDAVSRQMMADVPVGVLLSGGVDSSIITAMAVRASGKVKTFNVGFPGFGKYDETPHARLIARHFGTEHIELNAGQIGPDLLPRLARQYDEPVVDSSMIPTFLVSQLVRQHCTVALGGDGGDELFGGYEHYSRLLWTKQNMGWTPLSLRRVLAHAAPHVLPSGFKGRNWLQSIGQDLDHKLPLVAVLFDAGMRKRLMARANPSGWHVAAERIWDARVPDDPDFLTRVTRMDFENYMAEDILVKVDRASMLNSLELRAPLLDHRIIDFAFGRVPSSMKATTTERKILLKKLAGRLLPPEFDKQRKQGFSIPIAQWLQGGPWRDCFHDVLLDGRCVFDRKAVTDLLKWQDQGRNNNERLFGLVMFELWRREYAVSI